MRGEKKLIIVKSPLAEGSPPLARGKDASGFRDRYSTRITPACAGKRSDLTRFLNHSQDHPRLRGEKTIYNQKGWPEGGSPPLARGKAQFAVNTHAPGGITPACAGKRLFRTLLRRACWDHPRLRGEKSTSCVSHFLNGGSPPLARGKGSGLLAGGVGSGITPACAGKRNCVPANTCDKRDHPRLRGEKPFAWLLKVIGKGSPPLARGKAIIRPCAPCVTGITPACAGKRRCSTWRQRR